MDTKPTWDWSSADNPNADATPSEPDLSSSQREPAHDAKTSGEERAESKAGPDARSHGPRTCRICLEVVHPTYPESTTTFGIPTSSGQPSYLSEDPDLGRLLSPCKCKGSQKYVHEGCLKAWRMSNPTQTRNYWQCPTCKYTYRMSRLRWATLLSSRVVQAALSFHILILCIFILGFIADPILDMWFDPVGTISDTVTSVITDIEARTPPVGYGPSTWREHFLKGFFSLGLVGFAKTALVMSPWQWWQIRNGGLMGTGRRGATGRDRMGNMSILIILIGAATFFMGIWKTVQALSKNLLRRIGESVMDIGEDDDNHQTQTEAKQESPETLHPLLSLLPWNWRRSRSAEPRRPVDSRKGFKRSLVIISVVMLSYYLLFRLLPGDEVINNALRWVKSFRTPMR